MTFEIPRVTNWSTLPSDRRLAAVREFVHQAIAHYPAITQQTSIRVSANSHQRRVWNVLRRTAIDFPDEYTKVCAELRPSLSTESANAVADSDLESVGSASSAASQTSPKRARLLVANDAVTTQSEQPQSEQPLPPTNAAAEITDTLVTMVRDIVAHERRRTPECLLPPWRWFDTWRAHPELLTASWSAESELVHLHPVFRDTGTAHSTAHGICKSVQSWADLDADHARTDVMFAWFRVPIALADLVPDVDCVCVDIRLWLRCSRGAFVVRDILPDVVDQPFRWILCMRRTC